MVLHFVVCKHSRSSFSSPCPYSKIMFFLKCLRLVQNLPSTQPSIRRGTHWQHLRTVMGGSSVVPSFLKDSTAAHVMNEDNTSSKRWMETLNPRPRLYATWKKNGYDDNDYSPVIPSLPVPASNR